MASRRVLFHVSIVPTWIYIFFKQFFVTFGVLYGLVMAMSKFQIVQMIAGSVTVPLKVMASAAGAFLRACLILL